MLSQMSTNYTLQTEELKSHLGRLPKLLGIFMIHSLEARELPTKVLRCEVTKMSSFSRTLLFRSFYPLGAGIGPMARRLMHARAWTTHNDAPQ